MPEKYPSPYKHVVLSQQFDPEFLEVLFKKTDEIRVSPEKFKSVLEGKIVALLFYEPSTRTRFSFESAVQKLGGSCITTENASEFSSAAKGETLEDSMRVVSKYCDLVVLRHFDDDAALRALKVTEVPFINAGSGASQHPTQALLDVYTISKEFGSTEKLKVAVVGDLLRGRTCDSLVYLLSKFTENEFFFVFPPHCQVKEGLRSHLDEHNFTYHESHSLDEVVSQIDVLYMTRIQKERFKDEAEYKRAKGNYELTKEVVSKMKHESIIMHPLPRVGEIPLEIDNDHRARYFEQAENGLWIRMALLTLLFEHA